MILCIGTTPVLQRTMTFARLELDAVNRAADVIESASGKSLNVARVAHTLGEPVATTGFLGGDSGQFLRADLERAGIAQDFVEVEPNTRTCVTIIDRRAGQTTELVEESKPIDPVAWGRLDETLERLLGKATVMVLSGSLPPGAPPEFYERCARRAQERGIKVIIDASGEPLRHALPARPLIVKPNRAELARTLGVSMSSQADLRSAIARLLDGGPQWALVTEGKAGAILSDGTGFWRLRSPEVRATNPIGSGDSVAAGLAVGIRRGLAVIDAARLGIACGAANAMTFLPGHVEAGNVAELAKQVEISDC